MFENLKGTKNLLAFSGGVDSTALFFMLLENSVDFDIAIIDYNIRVESKLEVAYAEELSEKYSKKIFKKSISLESDSNFESRARDERYRFFDEIIKKENYEILILAHQLNDKFEWFLMQFSKGAGAVELFGMNDISKRKNYKVVRPLLNFSKKTLFSYLTANNFKFFEDKSNADQKYKRNFFRHNFSDKFIEKFESGVKTSFEFLAKDIDILKSLSKEMARFEELVVFEVTNNPATILRTIDFELKKRGILLSSQTKQEILKQKQITISDKFCVALQDDLVWICPKSQLTMDKKFKECSRIANIPQNIRPYLKKILGECNEVKKLVGSLRPSDSLFLDK